MVLDANLYGRSDRTHEGRFLGFDDHGFLRLEVAGEEERIGAGEIMESTDSEARAADGGGQG